MIRSCRTLQPECARPLRATAVSDGIIRKRADGRIMPPPFGAADRNRVLHYCSSARCRREFLAHDFSHLIGGHGLYGGSDVLSERIVDERLVSRPSSGRFGLECRHNLIVEIDRDSRLAGRRNRLPAASLGEIVLSLHSLSAPLWSVCEPKSGAPRRHVPSRRQPTTRRSRSCRWLSNEPRLATTRLQ